MIRVTRLDRQVMLLNPDHIVTVEETPDTVITLYNGHHILVKERAEVIVSRIVAFRSKVLRRAGGAGNGLKYLRRKDLNKFTDVTIGWVAMQDTNGIPLHRRDV